MVYGLTYGGHSSKKVVLPIRKMAGKVLGGACRDGVLQGGGALEGSRGRQHSGTLRLRARFHFQLGKRVPAGLAWRCAVTRRTSRVGRGKCFHGGGGHQLGTTHEWSARLGAVPGQPLTWCTPKQQPKWSK